MIELDGHRFEESPLLGPRARLVYEQFVLALQHPGDLAECGVYNGVTSREFVRYLEAKSIIKTVHLFDSFAGFPDVITSEERELSVWSGLEPGVYACDEAVVRQSLSEFEQYRLHPGRFEETLPSLEIELCFIHSDSDLYASTLETIDMAERLLVPGGIIVFDDYGNPRLPGVRLAVDRRLSLDRFEGGRVPGTIQYVATRRRDE